MDTLGDRLKYARKAARYTQDSLAAAIGVSRGVIFNLEKGKTVPQAIVFNAICQVLHIRREWLEAGTGPMQSDSATAEDSQVLTELYEVAKDLSPDEQLYLLDMVKAMKHRLNRVPHGEGVQ